MEQTFDRTTQIRQEFFCTVVTNILREVGIVNAPMLS
jgi:hypothetical protein